MNAQKQLSQDFWNSIKRLNQSSELKYKSKDYKGAIEDKREIKRKIQQISKENEAWNKLKTLLKETRVSNSNYDLIQDYKKRIDESKKIRIISMLEERSNAKYNSGDYEGSIKDLRRAEKYY